MLTTKDIEHYKQQMEIERSRLLQEIEENSTPKDFGSDVDGFDEETNEAAEFQNELGVSEALRERVDEIDGALNRIQEGAYGKCTRCGKEISKEVLDAAPESELCLDCKKAAA